MEYTTKQIIDFTKYINGKYNIFRTYQKTLIDLTKNYDGLKYIKLQNIWVLKYTCNNPIQQ